MKKLLVFFVFCLLLAFSTPALAQSSGNAQIPEKNGDYPDPEHPGIRVRVFVHEPKDARGSQISPTSCTDNDSTSIIPPAGWKLPPTWTYKVNLNSAPSSIRSNVGTIVGNSFNAWQSLGKVSFIDGGSTTANKQANDGQNIVAWGRTQGTALAVTYTRYYTSTGQVADVDTIMNLKFPWSWTQFANGACGIANTYDAQDILTHELGHWMGLNDTYAANFVDNTMYGSGATGEIKKDTLTTGDITGIQNIYH